MQVHLNTTLPFNLLILNPPAILRWEAALILFSRPLLLGLQLHSSLLLRHMSPEGDTKGFIICSSELPDKSVPPSPPTRKQAGKPLPDVTTDMKSCRGTVPWLSYLSPPACSSPGMLCRSCSFMIQS